MKTIAICLAANNNKSSYQNLVALAIKKTDCKIRRILNRKFLPFFQLLSFDKDIVQFFLA